MLAVPVASTLATSTAAADEPRPQNTATTDEQCTATTGEGPGIGTTEDAKRTPSIGTRDVQRGLLSSNEAAKGRVPRAPSIATMTANKQL